MSILIVFGFLAAGLFAVLMFGFLLPLRRSRKLERKAREMGVAFVELAKPFEGTNVQGLSVLEDGSATFVDNLLERNIGDCRCLIFDVPLVDDSANLVTTMAAFRLPYLHLPIFQVGGKNAIERMVERAEQAMGKKVIEFGADREFAKHFSIRCSDQGEVRAFLTPAKVAFLRDHAAHYRVESSPDWLFIYRPGVKVETTHLQEFADVTSAIASAMLSVQATPFPATA
jgi:hypothetical protein